MLMFSSSVYAEVPAEIQGVWIPNVEKTILRMNENMGNIDAAYMKDKYLPRLKRTITEDQYIAASGKREYKANISLKEKQANNFVMVLTSTSAPDITISFIRQENSQYIMLSQNPADGSGNIVWRKQ